ncbi:hypothetical protein GCM10023231_03040 [Olivibacter ginsenosidimutans]|uniref:THIF-type NAD/FAD binding fold domain-containing protein n=1 Tax=Olivibacter ginsenosidimutans TaxID=1176537 RepID=A0ABP9AFS7_9SPHI
MNLTYLPLFYDLSSREQRDALNELMARNPAIQLIDNILEQIQELVRVLFPSETIGEENLKQRVEVYLQNVDLATYGTWVYYPWLEKIVHLLNEEDFIRVRTSRNMYKIDQKEIATLGKKKIGVLGLSVGQSVALTLAMERTCGEIRLADFDHVELSNMNRLRCSITDLGINKAILAARQIAELDPYIKVRCYTDGATEDNLDDLLLVGGKLDLLVEECDGINMKILSRLKAKEFQIPVLMDTNDSGMLDMERFDLEPDRPILHGRLKVLEGLSSIAIAEQLRNLSFPEKIKYLSEMIGIENVSDAMKRSLPEMNKTIVGWPQLASSVMLGGAMITDVARRVLLGQLQSSGRFFVEFADLINDDPDKDFCRS